jgi:hypothetical protein
MHTGSDQVCGGDCSLNEPGCPGRFSGGKNVGMSLTPPELAELRARAERAAMDQDGLVSVPGSTLVALLDLIEGRQPDTAGAWPDELTAMGFAPDS